ncbi:TPA: excalibur calcium-binding domain-containing protein [Pseudomonas aeruginosa]|uniref:excalibur calcium-binding domain-containing protein n=1 Tax=Pseudomonas sp. NCCP-436 TaxID=2842481 RepID=UPI001C80DE8E|nr:excalibur calcium-binding domain-containing protein [Pseudomonas sp. NCCP-436]
MKKWIVLLAVGFGIWHFYFNQPASPVITNISNDGTLLNEPIIKQPSEGFSLNSFLPSFSSGSSISSSPVSAARDSQQAAKYRCDGRTHCSQMRSCEEATFFLNNCPGTKMDGNQDGVPCEQQWCR